MQHSAGVALGRKFERTVRRKFDEKVQCNSPNLGEYGNNRLLALLEPVHNPFKDVGAVEERLTVSMPGGVQQTFLGPRVI